MFYFNEPIKARMGKVGIFTQQCLADKTGLSTGTISKVMSDQGCINVNLGTLISICDVIGGKVWQVVKEAEQAK